MSINQIQEIPTFPGNRPWLNSRVDDLNIYSELDIDINLASVGDVLVIDSLGNPSWVPNSSLLTLTLDHMMTLFIAHTFVAGTNVHIPLNIVPIISSPNISINGNGELFLPDAGIYMLSVNINVLLTLTTQNASLSLERWDPIDNQFRIDGDGLGVSAIVPTPPSVAVSQTLASTWPVVVSSSHPTNNRFRITGANPGSSSVSLDVPSSSFTVVRIS